MSAAGTIHAKTASETDAGLKFERIMKWDEFPSAARRGDPLFGGEGGGREEKIPPKVQKAETPSACFVSTTRGQDQLSV